MLPDVANALAKSAFRYISRHLDTRQPDLGSGGATRGGSSPSSSTHFVRSRAGPWATTQRLGLRSLAQVPRRSLTSFVLEQVLGLRPSPSGSVLWPKSLLEHSLR